MLRRVEEAKFELELMERQQRFIRGLGGHLRGLLGQLEGDEKTLRAHMAPSSQPLLSLGLAFQAHNEEDREEGEFDCSNDNDEASSSSGSRAPKRRGAQCPSAAPCSTGEEDAAAYPEGGARSSSRRSDAARGANVPREGKRAAASTIDVAAESPASPLRKRARSCADLPAGISPLGGLLTACPFALRSP